MTAPRVSLDEIDVPDRLRPVDAAWVELIAASLGASGLKQPIILRPHPTKDARYLLVAGAHRLAAARHLGWAEIAADVQPLDDLAARLVEIDENLARRELSVLDRAIFLAERKRIYERLHPETKLGGTGRGRKKNRVANVGEPIGEAGLPRFTAATAEVLGLSERAVQRFVQLAELLDDRSVAALRKSPMADNAAQLFAFAALSEEDRRAVATVLGRQGATTIAAALEAIGKGTPDVSESERLYRVITAAWSRADQRTKKRVLKAIGAVASEAGA